ncbi:CBS domain-containing protein [Streptomyces misionensis]|uniref:CBS domain-containing protein n=1 Tax=Streptomyces misionensis TaxID=67331 RepID=UPI0033D2B842
MERHENFSARSEARGDQPARPPGETARQGLLLRYLGAVAEAAARHRDEVEQAPSAPAAPRPEPVREGPGPGRPTVREVMDVPAAHVPADLPYRDIARVLADEQAGALPVVDAEDRVVGVVSESDLLAKVAFEASGHRPGPIGRLRERRLHGKAHGETAADLMTSPAITVLPGATVAEAAWLAALSRLKRMPVTDHSGRLVGVVRRDALLQVLLRDDAGIRTEVETTVAACCPPADRKAVRVTVHDGVVELTGRMPAATADRLLAEVEKIADVVEVKNLTTAD